jgi:hypothetical protein
VVDDDDDDDDDECEYVSVYICVCYDLCLRFCSVIDVALYLLCDVCYL